MMAVLRLFGRAVGRIVTQSIAIILSVCLIAVVVATAANYSLTQGSGTTFASAVIGGVNYAEHLLCDPTAGATQCAGVNSSGQLAIAGPVTNAGTFAVQSAQSGTWTVQPGNTANSTAWLVTGTGGTFPATQSGTWNVNATLQASATTAIGKVDPNTIANWGLVASTQNSTTPTNGQLIEGQFNTSPTTITSGNVSPLQLDSAGNLLVNIKAGAGSGGTALADGSTFTIGTTSETPMGCTYVSGGITVTTGKASVVTCTAAGSLHTTVDNTNANGQTTMSASSPVVLASNQALPWTGGTAATAPTSASLTGAIGVTADQTAVTNGQMVAPEATPNGKLIVQPWAITPNLANGGGSSTGTGTFTILAASGSASLKEYVTGVQCGRSDAGTTAVTVAISDGTTTRTLVVPNNGGGGGNNVQFVTPVAYAANTAVTAAFSTGVTTGYCNAEGFYAP